jgi:aminoglycoside phosphotransferase (APT) family kinase protein
LRLAHHPEQRRLVSAALVDTLVALHAIDVSAPPLADLGKPGGFVERQVRGWTERWERAKTADVPDMEALARWLAAHLPPDAPNPAVVHGDFKLDNVMLDPLDYSHVVAVLDWEMSALGDPLVDLGILLAYWMPWAPPGLDALPATVTDRPGWFSRQEIIDHYGARSGHDLSNIRFYETFALFKIAVVIQQIFYRYTHGQTDDARFISFGDRVAYLARQAASHGL